MKIDIKTLNYACHQHGVQCKLKAETIEVNHKEYALKEKVCLPYEAGREYIQSDILMAISTMLPKRKTADVLLTYAKVMKVKLWHCKTEITDLEPLLITRE